MIDPSANLRIVEFCVALYHFQELEEMICGIRIEFFLNSIDWRGSDELSVEAKRVLGAVLFYSFPKIDNKS